MQKMIVTKILLFFYFYEISAFPNEERVRNVGPEKIYYDLKEAEVIFKEFIETYHREYNQTEYQYRFGIFKKTLEDINRRNKESGDVVHGITEFADMTLDEFIHDHTGLDYDKMLKQEMLNDTVEVPREFFKVNNVPDHWDWRTKGLVTPVMNQRHCGSCWSFSAAGCVEGQYAKKYGRLLQLSPQQMLDCYKKTCSIGDWPHNAMNIAARMGGYMLEKDYPYTSAVGACKFNQLKAQVKVIGGKQVNMKSEEDLKRLVYNYGPVSLGIYASAGFLTYHSGIATAKNLGCRMENINHAVVLVGYGEENGVPYWIVKNSAGSHWGEQGYIRLARGSNTCNILYYVAVATIA